jgi:hypothetical protein
MASGKSRLIRVAVPVLAVLALIGMIPRMLRRADLAPKSEKGALAPEPLPAPPAAAAASPGTVQRPIRVRDPKGDPVRARLRASVSNDHFKTSRLIDLEADGAGLTALGVAPEEWVVLDIRSPGFAGVSRPPVTWSELESAGLEILLEAAVRVQGATTTVNGATFSAVRIQFRPEFPPGDFAGQVATRMGIVDEEITTDSLGRFSCASLRPADYRLTFPDHPDWPVLRLSASELRSPTVRLRIPWVFKP